MSLSAADAAAAAAAATRRRWYALAACVLLESVAGSSYAFSVYSNELKAKFNYSQDQIESAGSLGNVGLYLAIVAGLSFDVHGPVVGALIGASLAGVGYALLYAAAAGTAPTSLPLVSLYCFLWSHGSSWLDTVAVSTSVKNFPSDRGAALGVLKALFGLSASLLTLFYSSIFKPNVTSFLGFLACLIPAVAVFCTTAIRVLPQAVAAIRLTTKERSKIGVAYGLVVGIAIYLGSVALAQQNGDLSANPFLAYLLIPMVLTAAGVLMLPTTNNTLSSKDKNDNDDEDGETLLEKQYEEGLENITQQTSSTEPLAPPPPPGATFLEGAFSLDFALWCIMLYAGTGAGLTLINNLGSLTKALGAEADGQDVYVVILSIGNCLGRAAFGYCSDAFSHKLSRPGWATVIVALMAVAQGVLAIADLNILYAGVALTGFAYGGYWSVGPALIADRFGTRAFASIYSLSSIFTAISSYTMSALMASAIYESHITVSGATDCTAGKACFQESFIILSILCVCGTVIGIYLTYRLKGLYDPDTGKAIPYTEWRKTKGGQNSAITRSAQRVMYSLCCCPCGRGLVIHDDEVEEVLYGSSSRSGGGGGGRTLGNNETREFDGDLSMYTYEVGGIEKM